MVNVGEYTIKIDPMGIDVYIISMYIYIYLQIHVTYVLFEESPINSELPGVLPQKNAVFLKVDHRW